MSPDQWDDIFKVLKDTGTGEWEVTANDKGVFIWGDEKVLELDSGDRYTALWMYLMNGTLKMF